MLIRSSFLRSRPVVLMMGKRNRAAVVVLGDLGRSPRMQYHTLSLASQAGMEVDVIAYSGSEPHPDLIGNPQIHLHLMDSTRFQRLPRIFNSIFLPLRLLLQTSILLWILIVRIPAPDFFLLQNPPSIPTFTVVRWASWLKNSAFIIDWHNFGYTLLRISFGAHHPLVKIYSWYERKFGRSANGHICVTEAMRQELQVNWDIKATVLYDRAPRHFHATSIEEKHELFQRLSLHPGVDSKGHSGLLESGVVDDHKEFTLFTTTAPSSNAHLDHLQSPSLKKIALKENRPALIISSTSWTADEDFGILLEAAVCYDRRVSALLGEVDGADAEAVNGPFPFLHIIVTGKGPLRETYERQIQKLRLRRVTFQTMWVSSQDYPLLLGSADLGVCLHTSSSGLDLPMKVVDMFGCGLPVSAVSYSCINELVKDGENGLLFDCSSQLANQFLELFKGFPDECELLNNLRLGAAASGLSSRWDDEWGQSILPLIQKVA